MIYKFQRFQGVESFALGQAGHRSTDGRTGARWEGPSQFKAFNFHQNTNDITGLLYHSVGTGVPWVKTRRAHVLG